ncbi:MAG: hypothetical protein MJ108_07400 [Saccharofermentans sp.]|nr:hypothetical protein [Saccharofermentans sp.]
MKKSLIPMILVAATLLTGCAATDTKTIETKNAPVIAEETSCSDPAGQPAETTIAPVVAPVITEQNAAPAETATLTDINATPAESNPAPAIETNPNISNNSLTLDSYPAYKTIVSNVKTAVTTNSQSILDLSPAIAHFMEICPERYPEEAILVTLYDINNDNSPELFFCRYTADYSGILILDMYTLNNGSAVKVISSESYESYAYNNNYGIVHADDTQLIDLYSLEGTTLHLDATFGPDDGFTYAKNAIPGTTAWLANC